MEKKYNETDFHKIDDEIDIQELFNVLFNNKFIIISITSFISLVGIIFSLLLPNIYESKALLVSSNPSSSISGALRSYSSFAGLAGLTMPTEGNQSNSIKAISKINSLSFFENNIYPKIFLPNLMAVESWDSQTNTLNYDENLYDAISKTWVRNSSHPRKSKPSIQESFLVFKRDHFSLNQDKKTGFITISIKHQSPYIAKELTELIVDEVNAFYRHKDKLESEKAVNYLNNKILMTNLSEIKLVISELLQKETQKLALIEANKSYVFDYIDPPSVMEKKAEPNRVTIILLSGMIGIMFSFLLVFARHFSKK